jgi:hypothetical protein
MLRPLPRVKFTRRPDTRGHRGPRTSDTDSVVVVMFCGYIFHRFKVRNGCLRDRHVAKHTLQNPKNPLQVLDLVFVLQQLREKIVYRYAPSTATFEGCYHFSQ